MDRGGCERAPPAFSAEFGEQFPFLFLEQSMKSSGIKFAIQNRG